MNRNILKLCSTKNFLLAKRNASVCIVGAGPAGFYAAMHLSKYMQDVSIDIIEKLPVPFGLIRYGVAPDHPEVKNVINQFNKVVESNPQVNFYGNITVGKDISLSTLREYYNAVLLTYGAEEDKMLGIENENADNVIAARKFVGWYNGLPHDKNLKVDLSGSTAAVFGQGNVALDVARILLTNVDDLRKTDITEHALSALSESKLKELYLVGRRGPLQVAFTIKELREQLKLKNCQVVWNKEDFIGVADIVPDLVRPRKRLTELMVKSVNEMNNETTNGKYFKPIFYRSPNKIVLDDNKRLSGVELICNKLVGDKFEEQKCVPTDVKEILNCQLVLRSIGYKSVKIDKDLNFDAELGIMYNNQGRIIEAKNNTGKLYVAGWLGTGPAGVILHTMSNAFQVAKIMAADLKDEESKEGFNPVRLLLGMKNIQIVEWDGWKAIDKYEVEAGKKLGKPREKICDIHKMLEIANTCYKCYAVNI